MKKYKIYQIIILTFCIFLSSTSCTQTAAIPTATVEPTETIAPTATAVPSSYERKVTIDNLERSYLLYIPPGLDSQQPVPVVFAFHGYGEKAIGMERMSGLNDVANLANFIAVYPKGVFKSWNIGEELPGYAVEHKIDDSAFVREILLDLSTLVNIDPKHIYAVGFSQGGQLAYRLACDMSDTLAAIASVSGGMEFDACQPSQAVSILHVHGLIDGTAPFIGGGIYQPSPVINGIDAWVQFNDCTGSAQVETQNEGYRLITHTAYGSCQDNTAVELYIVESGAHDWPSHFMPISEIIWGFFATHPKP